jgi:hypothetical protein
MRIGVTANVGGDPERVRYPVVRLVAWVLVDVGAYEAFVAQKNIWAFIAESCDGCATNMQVRQMVVRAAGNTGKFYCGLIADLKPKSHRRSPGPSAAPPGTFRRPCVSDLVECHHQDELVLVDDLANFVSA